MSRVGVGAPALVLAERELVRFLRQPSRIVGALATPLIFWIVIGSGLGSSFRPSNGDPGYLRYLFPGGVLLVVLFTSIFSAMSLIEDRQEGFLQSVLVSPAPRSSIVLGKVLGGASIATLQGMAFLLLAPFAGFAMNALRFVQLSLFLFAVSFALTALGFAAAWRIDSTSGYHGVMNVVLMPMWLLSGSVFPASGAAAPVRVLMRANPVAYADSGLRDLLGRTAGGGSGRGAVSPDAFASLPVSIAVTVGFGLVCFAAALVGARRSRA